MLLGKDEQVARLADLLKVKNDRVEERVQSLMDSLKTLERTVQDLSARSLNTIVDELFELAGQNEAPFPVLVKKMDTMDTMDKKSFAGLIDALSDRMKNPASQGVFVLGTAIDGKALFGAVASPALVKNHGIHCGNLVKTAASVAGGGGGGSPVRAQAGGKMGAKMDEALQAVSADLQKAYTGKTGR